MRPHINPARQESTGRGGHCNGLPLLFLGGLNRALLRSCCGAPVTADFHAGGGFYRVAARSCTGLTRGVTLLYSTILLC